MTHENQVNKNCDFICHIIFSSEFSFEYSNPSFLIFFSAWLFHIFWPLLMHPDCIFLASFCCTYLFLISCPLMGTILLRFSEFSWHCIVLLCTLRYRHSLASVRQYFSYLITAFVHSYTLLYLRCFFRISSFMRSGIFSVMHTDPCRHDFPDPVISIFI